MKGLRTFTLGFKTNIPISSVGIYLGWILAWLGFLGPWVGLELIKMQEEGLVGLAEPRKHLSLL